MAVGNMTAQLAIEVLSQQAEQRVKQFANVSKTSFGNLEASLRVARISTEQFNEKWKDTIALSRRLAVALTAVGAAMALVLKSAATEALSVEAALTEVATISDDVAANTEAYRKELEKLASVVGEDQAALAKGLYQTISAGITDAAEALDVLEVSAKAAVGGLTSTFTAVDGITTLLNAYGLEASQASKVSDKMFTTVRLGKVTFDQLAGSIGTSATVAATSGVKMEELLASIVAMTLAGQDLNVSMTFMNNVILGILKPTEDAKAAFIEMGIEFGANALAGGAFAETLAEVALKTDGNAAALQRLFPEKRAYRGAVILAADGARVFTDALDEQTDALGASEDAFEKMAATAGAAMKRLRTSVSNVKVAIGSGLLPAINAAEPGLNALAEAIAEIARSRAGRVLLAMATGFTAVAVAAGPLLFVLPGIAAGWNMITASAARAWIAMLGPAAIVVAILSGLALIITMLTQGHAKAKEQALKHEQALAAVGDTASNVEEAAKTLEDALEDNGMTVEEVTAKVADLTEEWLRFERDAAESVADAADAITDATQDIADAWEDAGQDVADAQKAIDEAVADGARAQSAAADDVADASQRVSDAYEKLADVREGVARRQAQAAGDAAFAEEQAQKRIDDAQKRGQDAIESAQDRLATLEERQRRKGLSRAAVRELEKQDALDAIAEARIAVMDAEEKAANDLANVRTEADRRVQKSQEQLASVERAGIQRIADAQNAVAEAIEKRNKAVEKQGEVAVEVATKIAEAEQGLQEAIDDATENIIDAFERREEAVRNWERTVRDVNEAISDQVKDMKAQFDELGTPFPFTVTPFQGGPEARRQAEQVPVIVTVNGNVYGVEDLERAIADGVRRASTQAAYSQ